MQIDARDIVADYQQQLATALHRCAEASAVIKALERVIAEREARIAELESPDLTEDTP
jgi:multidrug resistance efflux pump